MLRSATTSGCPCRRPCPCRRRGTPSRPRIRVRVRVRVTLGVRVRVGVGVNLGVGEVLRGDHGAAVLGAAVEVVEVAVVGGEIGDGEDLALRAGGDLAGAVLLRREGEVHLVRVLAVAGLARGLDLLGGGGVKGVDASVVRVYPAAVAADAPEDLVLHLLAGVGELRRNLGRSADVRPGARAGSRALEQRGGDGEAGEGHGVF
mmetsp:Transcript_9939/g.29225  ORF Transcript_9939/g.29225 Transcript_9939/m.29225 type:complete len:203 (+) Transcript_9939:39-647(+)